MRFYKLSLFVLGIAFLCTANAEICQEEYNKRSFDHVSIWKNEAAVCYYFGYPYPYQDFYSINGNYEPKDGPWVGYTCNGLAEDCRFKKVMP